MHKQRGHTSFDLIAVIAVAAIILAAIGGWIANVVKLVGMLDGSITAMFVARVVGIFIAPLGSILGFC